MKNKREYIIQWKYFMNKDKGENEETNDLKSRSSCFSAQRKQHVIKTLFSFLYIFAQMGGNMSAAIMEKQLSNISQSQNTVQNVTVKM